MSSVEKNLKLQRVREYDKLRDALARSVVSLRAAAAYDDFFLASARREVNLPAAALSFRFLDALSIQNEAWATVIDNDRVNEVLNELKVTEQAIKPALKGASTGASKLFIGFWVFFLVLVLAVKLLSLNALPSGLVIFVSAVPVLQLLWVPARLFNFLIRRKFDEKLGLVYEAVDEIAKFTLRNAQSPQAGK